MFAVIAVLAFLQADREVAVPIRDSEVTVVFPTQPLSVSRDQVVAWVKACGDTMVDYFGKFPVEKVRLELSSKGKGGVKGGRTWNGRLIRIELGSATSEAGLRDDWMLTHEFCHLSFPDLDEKFAWVYEGMAVYTEPIARVRSGRMKAPQMWKETLEGMPKGLPGPSDGALDGTTAWGRKYWGGALFWLRADLGIREKTKGAATLQTALRGILAAGGNGTQKWSPAEIMKKGDEATGTTVLQDLYREMGQAPYKADLPSLWKELGVAKDGADVVVDDQAPQAELRKALTSR
jgi:predicted metalloprotease with PDZ domain